MTRLLSLTLLYQTFNVVAAISPIPFYRLTLTSSGFTTSWLWIKLSHIPLKEIWAMDIHGENIKLLNIYSIPKDLGGQIFGTIISENQFSDFYYPVNEEFVENIKKNVRVELLTKSFQNFPNTNIEHRIAKKLSKYNEKASEKPNYLIVYLILLLIHPIIVFIIINIVLSDIYLIALLSLLLIPLINYIRTKLLLFAAKSMFNTNLDKKIYDPSIPINEKLGFL